MTDLDDLANELEDFAPAEKKGGRSPREERVAAGFEEIQRFYEDHRHLPQAGEGRDIFERIYAVRLDRIRNSQECRSIVESLDYQGLLGETIELEDEHSDISSDDLAAELAELESGDEISELRHVRSTAEIKAADEIAGRDRCEDFERFKPLFEAVQRDLKSGGRLLLPFMKDASIEVGNFFVLGGQTVYVAEVGDTFRAPNGEKDARLRVIFSNGTESNLLRRSLQRALYKDYASGKAGSRITDPDFGPLFSSEREDGDITSGTIYVLRSNSTEPFVKEHRDIIHKIGVTGGQVETRIADAVNDPTYLLASVEIVATYDLVDINRTKLENLLHKVFDSARLDLTLHDRFGKPVKPREWYLVPLPTIQAVVDRIIEGTITDYRYDVKTATLVKRDSLA
jgi:hypothetical protein